MFVPANVSTANIVSGVWFPSVSSNWVKGFQPSNTCNRQDVCSGQCADSEYRERSVVSERQLELGQGLSALVEVFRWFAWQVIR
jgi:hypothetical protein